MSPVRTCVESLANRLSCGSRPVRLWWIAVLAAGLAIGLGLGQVQTASAATITVCASGCNYTTIQAAVNAATTGDVISVGAGIYRENINIAGKSLVIQGAGQATTIIDGGGRERVITSTVASTDPGLVLKDLTVQNGYIARGLGIDNGTGAGVSATGRLTLTNVLVFSNTNNSIPPYNDGGGVYIEGRLTATNARFIRNKTNGIAGGLYADGYVNITGTTFTSNTAGTWAGGLYASGYVDIINTKFISNTAGSSGGGLRAYGLVNITDTQIVNNTSAEGGGGLSLAGFVSVVGSKIMSNTAFTSAGGMEFEQFGQLQIIGTQFVRNMALSDAGGLFVGSPANITDTQFISNSSGLNGGGMISLGSVTITGSLFMSNTAIMTDTSRGGGWYAYGPVTIAGTKFVRNSAIERGGGIAAKDTITTRDTQFLYNLCILYGGGLFAYGGTNLNSTQFSGNRAGYGGGLVNLSSQSMHIVNSLFGDNLSIREGGAIYFFNNSAAASDILFTTIASEPLRVSESAIYVRFGTLNITNTIVSKYKKGIDNAGGSVTSDYNLFYLAPTNIPIGTHSITGTNPLFVDQVTGDPPVREYTLSSGSPAYGKGIAAGVSVDLAGAPRPDPPTIGAYELQFLNLGLVKTAAIAHEIAYLAPVTYTIAFTASGNTFAPTAALTDVLPQDMTFARWVGTPPAGATQDGKRVGWTGTIRDGTAVTLTFAATNGAPGGSTRTNFALLWVRLANGVYASQRTYADIDTTKRLVATSSGLWSQVFPPCASVCDYVIPAGATVVQDIDVALGGDLTVEGTLEPTDKVMVLVGSKPQTLTGNPLYFTHLHIDKNHRNDTVTIKGKLNVTSKLYLHKGKLVSASEYADVAIEGEGELELTGDITVTGNITIAAGGVLTPNLAAVILNGGVPQRLNLAGQTTFYDLVVMTGTTLVEVDPNPNLLVGNTLTNYGTIRKSQTVTGAGPYTFGLAGDYAPADADVAIGVVTRGTLTGLQVDRIDAAPANPPPGATTGIYWIITAAGGSYTADLTLPHLHTFDPAVCRYVAATTWDCAASRSSNNTVTSTGITDFSTWAVFSKPEQRFASATALTSHPNPSEQDDAVTFTATVTMLGINAVGPLTPTGSVALYDGATAIGNAPLADGVATFATTTLAVGSHIITAAYGGDTNYQPSTSEPVTQVVRQPGYITVVKRGSGSGTVGSGPAGIACGATCRARFRLGSSVVLDAIAGDNAAFAGWSGACTGGAVCEVTMVAGETIVTATFNTASQPVITVDGKPQTGSSLVFSATLPINDYTSCVVDFGDRAQTDCTRLLAADGDAEEAADGVRDSAAASGVTVSASHVYILGSVYTVTIAAVNRAGAYDIDVVVDIAAANQSFMPSIFQRYYQVNDAVGDHGAEQAPALPEAPPDMQTLPPEGVNNSESLYIPLVDK